MHNSRELNEFIVDKFYIIAVKNDAVNFWGFGCEVGYTDFTMSPSFFKILAKRKPLDKMVSK